MASSIGIQFERIGNRILPVLLAYMAGHAQATRYARNSVRSLAKHSRLSVRYLVNECRDEDRDRRRVGLEALTFVVEYAPKSDIDDHFNNVLSVLIKGAESKEILVRDEGFKGLIAFCKRFSYGLKHARPKLRPIQPKVWHSSGNQAELCRSKAANKHCRRIQSGLVESCRCESSKRPFMDKRGTT